MIPPAVPCSLAPPQSAAATLPAQRLEPLPTAAVSCAQHCADDERCGFYTEETNSLGPGKRCRLWEVCTPAQWAPVTADTDAAVTVAPAQTGATVWKKDVSLERKGTRGLIHESHHHVNQNIS